jgi:DNA invertase Pin-like site-specific DNA recombinase
MDGPRWGGVSQRARYQAVALGLVFSADAIAAHAFGVRLWIALLYLGVGFGLVALRLHLGRVPLSTPDVDAAAPESRRDPDESAPLRAIGYVYVSGSASLDLDEQTAEIERCCEVRGLLLDSVVHDVERAGRGEHRPALTWALEQIAAERAETLVIGRLRDLSSNVANLAPLLSWFDSERRSLFAIDLKLDTSTSSGRQTATAIVGVGSWEHERISLRTRQGLQAARERGQSQGRTAVADIPELQAHIAGMRETGMTLQAIADVLNEEGVPTLRGGTKWRPSSVQGATGYKRPSSGGRGIELPRFSPSEGDARG